MWLPMNDISVKLFYDQRIIISTQEMEEPITWKISKVENIHPFGINKLTLAQTKFDPNTDRKVDGWWYADYATSLIEPAPEPVAPKTEGKIAFTGSKPQIKIGGSARKFTADFAGEWSYKVDGADISADLQIRAEDNSRWIEITDDRYVNKVLEITVAAETSQAVLLVEIRDL